MSDTDLEARLASIEQRLTQIERRLGQASGPAPVVSAPERAATLVLPERADSAPRVARPADTPRTPPTSRVTPAPSPPFEPSTWATSVLGWAGVLAFVLAASYLIRLGIDNGWLTPLRQVAMAAIAGLLVIGAGFALRRAYPVYAGYLPACGVVILFLAIYAAHLYYHLIGVQSAGVFVTVVCVLSLWLCRVFDSDLYALFAVAGSYSAPFLLASSAGTLTDVVIYFSAWSVVFSTYAIWRGHRTIYLLALYLALLGFSVIWQTHAAGQWVAGLTFQAVQFAIFGAATVLFYVRRREPLNTLTAIAHLPPLLLFYALQYAVLDKHLPSMAPWIAVLSLAAVGVLYVVARRLLDKPLPGGELLLWCYVSLVLFHVGYIELWPDAWAPWASFIAIPVAVLATMRREDGGLGPLWILWVTVAVIVMLNYLRVIANLDLQHVPGHRLLAIAYGALMYAGYVLVARRDGLPLVKLPLIYGGHISLMSAAVQLLQVHIVESTAWGLLALACLGLSMRNGNRMLGQSSLLVFGATAAKVLLYDLRGAQPFVRILSLVVLGVTFYVGGILYQRMMSARDTT